MKTEKYLFFLLLLLYNFFSSCDDNNYLDENPDFLLETVFINNDERLLNYNAVKNADREPFFIEEFNNNDSQFPYQIGIDTNVDVSIADGRMTIKYLKDDGYMYFASSPIEIDESRNYEMETSLIIYRNLPLQIFTWLPNRATSNEYMITSDNQSEFTLWKKTDDWEMIESGYDFNAKDFLDSNEFTVLTIRKIGNKYATFINHKLFYIINDNNFSYSPAITMDESVINVFDYFRVYYLP